MSTPNHNIPYVPEGTLDPAAGLNLALNVLDVLVQTAVISMDLTAPPGSPSDGDLYVVGFSPTGAWSGQARNVARYVAEGASWQFFAAGSQVFYVLNRADGGLYKFIDESPLPNWTLAAGLSDAPSDTQPYGRRDGAWEVIPDAASMAAGTVLTEDDESSTFANSRQLLAYAGELAFDDSVANERTMRLGTIPRRLRFAPNKEWRSSSAALDSVGGVAAVVLGTASTPAKSTGAGLLGYTNTRRHTSTTAANNVASFRSGDASDGCYAGSSGSASAAGLYFRMVFATGVVVAGERFFAGLALNAAEAGTVDPSSLLNCFGVAKDGADANFQIMHNDGADAATKIDTGLAFAANKIFELELYVAAGGGSWRYVLTDLDTGTVYANTVLADIPAADVALFWRLWASVGATAGTAVSVDCHYVGLRYPLTAIG